MTGNAIVRYLMTTEGAYPGRTLGEIEVAIGAPRGTATHQRISEKRQQGFPIRSRYDSDDGLWRYFVMRADVQKCKALLLLQASKRLAKKAEGSKAA